MVDASQIARSLAAAGRAGKPRSPVTDEHPDLDVATAYDAQWSGIAARLLQGEHLAGAKLGLTGRAERQIMRVDTPLYGWVTSSMLLPYGEPVELRRFVDPRAEPEIAFRLGRDIGTPATVTEVLAATDAVLAAVDVLDSRYEDFRFTLPDVIADNASAGGFLLGPRAVRPADLGDLRLLGCVLRVDGEVAATAAGAATMGHPAAAVAWLANRLAARDQVLGAGMTVFSGGLTEPVPLRAGRSVTVEIEELGTIEVTCR